MNLTNCLKTSDVIDLENIQHKCRICLMPSDQMIALTCKLDEKNNENIQISDALEHTFSIKVSNNPNYPEGVCILCYKHIKISYDLKITFNKSQYILEKYNSLLKLKPRPLENDEFFNVLNTNIADEHISLPDDHCTVNEFVEENSLLTDFVILQVTDDDDEQEKIFEESDAQEENKFEHYSENEDVEYMFSNESANEEETIVESDNQVRHPELANDSDNLEETDEQITSPSANLIYKCELCEYLFLDENKLQEHVEVCKDIKTKCDYCDQVFSSKILQRQHITAKHKEDRYLKCHLCDEMFENLKARDYHLKTRHAYKRYFCEICGKAFHFKNVLATHMDTHSKDEYKEICPECGKGFHYRGGLFYHMKIHRDERNYLCVHCSARFLNMSGLKKHIRIHTGEKPCKCEYCGKSFRSTSILRKHEKTHTGHRPHTCKYCGKGFISMYNLKIHMSGHTGSHPCLFCKRSYLNEEVLNLHMKFKHNVKDLDQAEICE